MVREATSRPGVLYAFIVLDNPANSILDMQVSGREGLGAGWAASNAWWRLVHRQLGGPHSTAGRCCQAAACRPSRLGILPALPGPNLTICLPAPTLLAPRPHACRP